MNVLPLSDVSKNDLDLAGGKAANLGALLNQGFPVPQGFVVTAPAYAALIETLHLTNHLEASENSDLEGGPHGKAIQQLIETTEIAADLKREILASHSALQGARSKTIVYAVRSSATAEDLSDASFAGQHATYYYVDETDLIEMIKKCWASLWSEAAISYRNSQGIDHISVHMAVVVQEMIPSEISGITFTANPLSGNRDEIVTESSWGMGAAIVDGRVSPDHYVVHRSSLETIEHRIANKKFMVPASLTAADQMRLEEVPMHIRQQETLNYDQLKRVTEWAIKAEEYFGGPQDLEWAIADGEFYLLQSRPITVLGAQSFEHGVSGRYVLFKPLAENFTEPVTPLSANMFIDFLPIMKLIRGRAYMDLKQIRPLIPFKVTDEEIARLAYLSGNREFTARLSLRKLPLFLLIMLVNYLISGVLYARTRRMPDDFMDSFRDRADLISGDPSVDARNSVFKLFAGTKFFEPVGNMALLINLTSSRYFVLMAVLKKILRRWLPELRRDAESLLCSGTEGILSTEMGRNIAELAIEAKRSPLVSRIIREDSAEEALHQLQRDQGAIPFMQQLSSFQAKHGHRALKEFELQSTRWEEDPSHVIGMIRNYLLVDSDPKELEDKARRTRLDLEDEIRETLLTFPLEKQLGIRWKLIDHIRNRAKYFIKLRENSRFYHIMGFFVVRKKILQIESELLSAGKLKCKDDVFYLRWHEVIDLSEGTLSWPDVEERIRQRRVEYIRQSKLMPPKTIGFDIAAGETAHDTSDPRALSGQGASPGYYEGYARVILDPAVDMELEPGEILVAPYTDPAWTPLFLTAHGAVVEVGSYLSHAGTIAREYGMPCIVDVPECTARIKTGDRISVNGTDGTVRLLQSVEAPA